MKKKIKALALLSGGLDSTLAVKLILDQGIDVVAVKFTSPFCLCDSGGKCHAAEVSKKFNIPLKIVTKGEEYLKVIGNPKYGYGSNMNPCIDCRIFMLKKTKKIAKQIGAKFIFTGEVLDERPMSQHLKALKIIEKEVGLENKILRPLSSKLLSETEAEMKGWVDRNKLLAIKGRSRKPQINLAKKFGINDYPCPAGGCLLTYKEFANKIRDFFKHKKKISWRDIELLKVGRHFRFGENKIIIGRNEVENKTLLRLKNKTDYIFEVPNYGSPITILRGKKTKEVIKITAKLTARYSDAKGDKVIVTYGNKEPIKKSMMIAPANQQEITKFRI